MGGIYAIDYPAFKLTLAPLPDNSYAHTLTRISTNEVTGLANFQEVIKIQGCHFVKGKFTFFLKMALSIMINYCFFLGEIVTAKS